MKDLPEATARLRGAVARCYEAFRSYHGEPGWVDAMMTGFHVCPGKPAREFSPAEIDDHYSHATYFAGKWQKPNQIQATKFFLPRMVDLLSGPEPGPGLMVFDWWWLGRQWREANWWDWPAEESGALREWIEAWWFATLTVDLSDEVREIHYGCPRHRCPQKVLAVGLLGSGDPLGLLACWDKSKTTTALLQLALVIVDNESTLQRRTISLPVDMTTEQERAQLAEWLMRPQIRDRLEQGFFRSGHPAVGWWLGEAVEAFDRIEKARAVLEEGSGL